MNIFLDTNFLIYCAKQKIDFVSEIERIFIKCNIYVLKPIIDELKILVEKEKGKEKEVVKLALAITESMLKKRILKEKKSKLSNADDALLEFDNSNSIIATLDKELKERFKNAKILTIRQKRYLFLS